MSATVFIEEAGRRAGALSVRRHRDAGQAACSAELRTIQAAWTEASSSGCKESKDRALGPDSRTV
jgi:hypothetical protein